MPSPGKPGASPSVTRLSSAKTDVTLDRTSLKSGPRVPSSRCCSEASSVWGFVLAATRLGATDSRPGPVRGRQSRGGGPGPLQLPREGRTRDLAVPWVPRFPPHPRWPGGGFQGESRGRQARLRAPCGAARPEGGRAPGTRPSPGDRAPGPPRRRPSAAAPGAPAGERASAEGSARSRVQHGPPPVSPPVTIGGTTGERQRASTCGGPRRAVPRGAGGPAVSSALGSPGRRVLSRGGERRVRPRPVLAAGSFGEFVALHGGLCVRFR